MIYFLLFIFSFIMTYAIKVVSVKMALVDIPNERSSHSVSVPHGGGISIAITWFIGITYLYNSHDINPSLYYALIVGVILSIVSYIDDIFELSSRFRLLIQALVSCLGLFFLGGLDVLNIFFVNIEFTYFNNLIAFLLLMWFINIYNFLDGIDGYAGSEAIFLAMAGFVLFSGSEFLILLASVSGFLIWNWQKAKIFMGDVGSTLLGYTIGILTLYYANVESGNFWVFIILFGVFWFDATLTLFRRYKNGEKLTVAHKKHAYQRLVQSGVSHEKVTMYSILVNICLFMLVYYFDSILLSLIISFVLLYACVKIIDTRKGFM